MPRFVALTLLLFGCAPDTPTTACPDLDRVDLPVLWGEDFEWFSGWDVVRHAESLWLTARAGGADPGIFYARYDCEVPGPIVWEPADSAPDTRSYYTFAVNGERLLRTRTEGTFPEQKHFIQVFDAAGEPVGAERELTPPDADPLSAGEHWAPYGEGWVGLAADYRGEPEIVAFALGPDGGQDGELTRVRPTQDGILEYSLGGPVDDPHIIWADRDREEQTATLRAMAMDGEPFDVVDFPYTSVVSGLPGSRWIDTYVEDRTELVSLDGTVRDLGDLYVLFSPDEGGLWFPTDEGVAWLPDGSTEPRIVASEDGHHSAGVTPLGDGRAAVLWMPDEGINSPDAGQPFVQVHSRLPE